MHLVCIVAYNDSKGQHLDILFNAHVDLVYYECFRVLKPRDGFRYSGEIKVFPRVFSKVDQNFFCDKLSFPPYALTIMKVSSANNVKVYTVSGEAVRTLPEWLIRAKKRQLKDDPGS